MSIVIYSKITCGYCTKAKEFLDAHNIQYTEFLLNEKDENYIIQRDHYFKKFNCHSFPMIVVNQTYIGGFSDLVHKYNTLELFDILGVKYENDDF